MTLEALDEPVRRYLAHALHGDAARARGVRLEMKGRCAPFFEADVLALAPIGRDP